MKQACIPFIALFLGTGAVSAADLTVVVNDEEGRPVANAVIELGTGENAPPVFPVTASLDPIHIDQKSYRFDREVTIVAPGTKVRFLNSDPSMHHVYSFSPLASFEHQVAPGEASEEVVYSTPGVAAIGCNIHDKMLTYVYVTDSPFALVTDADGKAVFSNLAPQGYDVTVWHGRSKEKDGKSAGSAFVTEKGTTLAFTLSLRSQVAVGRPKPQADGDPYSLYP